MFNKVNSIYNFQKLPTVKNERKKGYVGLHLGKKILNFSKEFATLFDIKTNRFVEFQMDLKNKAILVTPRETETKDSVSITVSADSQDGNMHCISLSNRMPLGRYYFKEESPEGYIAVQE